MEVEQVEKFVKESRERKYCWDIIRVVGGEPTLHPRFGEIMSVLREYVNDGSHSQRPKLIVCTNGFSKKTREIISDLPPDVLVDNSFKSRGAVNHIGHFNVAPIDIRDTSEEDFTIACTNASYCGLGLTPQGYYHCPVAGTIDRIFGFDLARSELPALQDQMHDLMNVFCRRCGFFDMDDRDGVPSERNLSHLTKPSPISPSWEAAYTELRRVGSRKNKKY